MNSLKVEESVVTEVETRFRKPEKLNDKFGAVAIGARKVRCLPTT